MTALGGWNPGTRESAAARARRRILRDLAGNVATAFASLRAIMFGSGNASRLAFV